VTDKAMNAICQTLSPSEFSVISHCETVMETWKILETTYEDTHLVKSAKLQMLVSQFEGIKMLEEESFNEFYIKISDLWNSMINLGKKISNARLIKKILRSLPERLLLLRKAKILIIWILKNLLVLFKLMNFFCLLLRKIKSIALKTTKEKSDNSSDEDGLTMFAWNFRKLMTSSNRKFRNKNVKFSENSKGDSKGTDQEKFETDKKNPHGPRCFECLGYGHISTDCGNLKQSKGKAFNNTLSDSDCDETLGKDWNYLAFAASYDSTHEFNSYYFENSGSKYEQNELQKGYNKLYVKFSELREVNKQHIKRFNDFEIEISKLIEKIKHLEDELIES